MREISFHKLGIFYKIRITLNDFRLQKDEIVLVFPISITKYS